MILGYKGKILPQPGSFYPGRLHRKSSLFPEKVLLYICRSFEIEIPQCCGWSCTIICGWRLTVNKWSGTVKRKPSSYHSTLNGIITDKKDSSTVDLIMVGLIEFLHSSFISSLSITINTSIFLLILVLPWFCVQRKRCNFKIHQYCDSWLHYAHKISWYHR